MFCSPRQGMAPISIKARNKRRKTDNYPHPYENPSERTVGTTHWEELEQSTIANKWPKAAAGLAHYLAHKIAQRSATMSINTMLGILSDNAVHPYTGKLRHYASIRFLRALVCSLGMASKFESSSVEWDV
jgi:hypothetical protein